MGIFCISLYAIQFFSSTIIIIGLCSQKNPSIEDLLRRLSLVMSMMVSFVLSFFPRDVLDEILN